MTDDRQAVARALRDISGWSAQELPLEASLPAARQFIAAYDALRTFDEGNEGERR